MNKFKIAAVLIASISTASPTLVFADAAWHPSKGDAVYEPHQGFKESGNTAGSAKTETKTYRTINQITDAGGDATQFSIPQNYKSSKTREQVAQELKSQSAQERQMANSN